jgi:phage terminase small subunit
LATRSSRPRSRSKAVAESDERVVAQPKSAGEFEDVVARAARLGISVERVLREYARIAFADLRHIAEWDADGLHVREGLSKADAAPISEISTGSSGKGPVRVKLYDKKAALDAIGRHLGMFPPPPKRQEEKPEEGSVDPAEDAREVLKRRVARLAARSVQE